MKRNRRSSGGFVLAVALILTAIIMVICSAVAALGIQQSGISYNVSMNAGAQNAAMAGLDDAMDMLFANPDWVGTELQNKPLTHIGGSYNVTFNTASAGYSTNNLNGTSDITRADGIKVPLGYAYIVSTGRVTGMGQPQRVACMVTIYQLIKGIIAKNNVAGVKIYGYTPPNAFFDAGTGQATANGTITATVDGPTYPNASLATSVFTPPTAFTGLTTYSSLSGNPLPPGNYTCALDSACTLGPGKYNFPSVSLSGNNTVTIQAFSNSTDICQIFVSGNIDCKGNGYFNNLNADPSRVLLFGGVGCTSISMCGNGTSCANIFAPKANFDIKGGGSGTPDFYGSMIVDSTSGSGSHCVIWYDHTEIPWKIKCPPRVFGFNHL
jgi:hypothetical protein